MHYTYCLEAQEKQVRVKYIKSQFGQQAESADMKRPCKAAHSGAQHGLFATPGLQYKQIVMQVKLNRETGQGTILQRTISQKGWDSDCSVSIGLGEGQLRTGQDRAGQV